ncbi:MAG TPA: FAD-dependent thymidylate synthase [Chloroflexota bacterium]
MEARGHPSFPPRRVYAVFGVPPELQAYAMAKYSRSSQGMLESIQELSQQQAEEFLRTFYFQYGHRSIADMAHLVFGLEQVSILAAIAVVDEPVWDGQERSTRYQPFARTGWYVPREVAETPLAVRYQEAVSALFGEYERLTQELLERLVAVVPRPDDLSESAYRRTLRARAFDVTRGLLPLATHTSVGQVVSARVLERQICRLLSSPYHEVREIAEALKDACLRPAEAPLLEPLLAGDLAPEMAALLRPRVAPTLVRYTAPSAYEMETAAALEEAARQYLAPLGPPDRTRAVELAEPSEDPVEEIVSTLLYRHDVEGHSYRQVREAVSAMSEAQRQEVFDLSVRRRGRHDDMLREHRCGYTLVFDVLVDLGAFRDLHRHRRCIQVAQPYTWGHGPDGVEDVFLAGLGPEAGAAALADGLGRAYETALRAAARAAAEVARHTARGADYLLPLAYRTRCLFKMDWAQAAYLIELRTGTGGHFSYRRIAWEMYQELRRRYPALAGPIRAHDPREAVDLLAR